MIVVDMESSGLDALKNSIVSVGAIEFENPENQFYAECRVWDGAHIEDEALAVNGFTREDILDPKKKTDREVVVAFLEWALKSKEHTIAGQNPYVDLFFLERTAYRYHLNWPLAHRILDLHSICFLHMKERGIVPPVKNGRSDLNLDKILNYVGLPDEPRPHNGLRGAKLEAEALSRLIYGKGLLGEYDIHPMPLQVQHK